MERPPRPLNPVRKMHIISPTCLRQSLWEIFERIIMRHIYKNYYRSYATRIEILITKQTYENFNSSETTALRATIQSIKNNNAKLKEYGFHVPVGEAP